MKKKALAMILASMMCLGTFLTSCQTDTTEIDTDTTEIDTEIDTQFNIEMEDSSYKVTQITLDSLKESDNGSFEQIPWLSTVEEVTEYFDISPEQKIVIESPAEDNYYLYSFCVNAYFPDFDLQGNASFYFITSLETDESLKTALNGNQTGLTGVYFDFYFESEEEAAEFEEKFIDTFTAISLSNDFFTEGFYYEDGSGALNIVSESYYLGDLDIMDSFWFLLASTSNDDPLYDSMYQSEYNATLQFGFKLSSVYVY